MAHAFIFSLRSPRDYDNEENHDRGHVLTSITDCKDMNFSCYICNSIPNL